MLWDVLTHRCLWQEELDDDVTALDFHPQEKFLWDGVWEDGHLLAVGLKNGHVLIGIASRGESGLRARETGATDFSRSLSRPEAGAPKHPDCLDQAPPRVTVFLNCHH